MDAFTNLLLVTLIGLVAWIGKGAYDKINTIIELIKGLAINHQKHESEIEQLKRNAEDHEERIRSLETNTRDFLD